MASEQEDVVVGEYLYQNEKLIMLVELQEQRIAIKALDSEKQGTRDLYMMIYHKYKQIETLLCDTHKDLSDLRLR